MCMRNTAETIHHVLFECEKWQGVRQGAGPLIQEALARVAEANGNEELAGNLGNLVPCVYLCCGGTLKKPLVGWSESLDLISRKELSDGGKRMKSEGTSPVSFLAKFLGEVQCLRMKELSSLIRTTGQSPFGHDGACTAQTQPEQGIG